MTGARSDCTYYDGHRSVRKGSTFKQNWWL